MKPAEDEGSSREKQQSVGELVDLVGYGCFQHFLMFQCGMVWMADAMEMMLMSYLLPRVKQEWNLSKTQEADIMTFTFFGMLIGGVRGGYRARAGGVLTSRLTGSALRCGLPLLQ